MNGQDYNDHLSCALDFLETKTTDKPPCLMKRDLAHLIKAICQWDHFKGDHWTENDSYACSPSLALKMKTLEEITRFMTASLIIAQSRTCTPTPKFSSEIKWLDRKIATFTVEQPNGNTCPENIVHYNYIDEDFNNSCP
ncbi:hypothetical protein QAD02_003639 [Eretmocerus hayati]|uniref:Uncharacterized protein n=1 Tax=Eretmocerus hayati TaxID=131215 RepID=A0ACC2NMH5_9HYME|nr:hypothetical protein QAD02_003639 [Eretmocerus hayati]